MNLSLSKANIYTAMTVLITAAALMIVMKLPERVNKLCNTINMGAI